MLFRRGADEARPVAVGRESCVPLVRVHDTHTRLANPRLPRPRPAGAGAGLAMTKAVSPIFIFYASFFFYQWLHRVYRDLPPWASGIIKSLRLQPQAGRGNIIKRKEKSRLPLALPRKGTGQTRPRNDIGSFIYSQRFRVHLFFSNGLSGILPPWFRGSYKKAWGFSPRRPAERSG